MFVEHVLSQEFHDLMSFCSCGLGIRELYELTFILLSSLSWKRTAPSPINEALTVMKKRCLVFGIVSSVSEVRAFLFCEIRFHVQ